MKRVSKDLHEHMQRTGNAEIAKGEAVIARMQAMFSPNTTKPEEKESK